MLVGKGIEEGEELVVWEKYSGSVNLCGRQHACFCSFACLFVCVCVYVFMCMWACVYEESNKKRTDKKNLK